MLSNISSWKEVNFDDGQHIKYNDEVIYEAIDKWSSILIVKDKEGKVFLKHIFHVEEVYQSIRSFAYQLHKTPIKSNSLEGKVYNPNESLTKDNMDKLVPVIYDGQNYHNLSIKDCTQIWGDDSESFNIPDENVEIPCGKKVKRLTIPSVPKEYKDYLNDLKRIEDEVKCMDKVKECKYVVKLYDVLRYTHKFKPTDESIFIVMELIEDGKLLEQIGCCGCESNVAKKYFRQLLEGLNYCHKMSICHRDISCNNILYSLAEDTVKLVDFGLSKEQMSGGECGSFLGTPNYYAPEVENSSYCGFKADCFSCGLIFYELLTGEPLFNVKTSYDKCPEYNNYKRWVELRDESNPDFLIEINAIPDPDYPIMFSKLPDNKLLRHFLCCMLHPNPEKRYDVEHLLNHPYLSLDNDDDEYNNNDDDNDNDNNSVITAMTPHTDVPPLNIPMPIEEPSYTTSSRSIMSSVPSLDIPTDLPLLNSRSLTQSCMPALNRDKILRSSSLITRSEIPPLQDGSKRFSRFYTHNTCTEILNKIKEYIENLDNGKEAIDAYKLDPELDEDNYSLYVYSQKKLVLQFKVYSSFSEHLVDVRNYKMQIFLFKKFFNELIENLQSCVSRTYDFRFFEKRKRSHKEIM